MASLTPLSKGLIALVVIGGMASAVWHLGLKEKWSSTATPTPAAPDAPVAPVATPTGTATPPAAVAPTTGAASGLSVAENAEMGRKLLDGGKLAQARPYLEAAVQGGDGPSACHLGEMTLKGQGGIAASQEQSAKWFQLAQSRGSICFASSQ